MFGTKKFWEGKPLSKFFHKKFANTNRTFFFEKHFELKTCRLFYESSKIIMLMINYAVHVFYPDFIMRKKIVKPHKISIHLTYSESSDTFPFFHPLCDWVEILWGSTSFFPNICWKFQLYILNCWPYLKIMTTTINRLP